MKLERRGDVFVAKYKIAGVQHKRSLFTSDPAVAAERFAVMAEEVQLERERVKMLKADKARKMAEIALNAITDEQWEAIAKKAIADAQNGDARARQWVTKILFGERKEVSMRLSTQNEKGERMTITGTLSQEEAAPVLMLLSDRSAVEVAARPQIEKLEQGTRREGRRSAAPRGVTFVGVTVPPPLPRPAPP